MRIITSIVQILVTLPIWLFLFYKILQAVDASELMWFLYWVYLPVTLIVSFLNRTAEEK